MGSRNAIKWWDNTWILNFTGEATCLCYELMRCLAGDSPVPMSSIPMWPQHKVGDGSLTSASRPGGAWMPLEGVWHSLLLLPIPFAHPALVASQSPWSFFNLPCYIAHLHSSFFCKMKLRACAELCGPINPTVPANISSFLVDTRICYSHFDVCNPHFCSKMYVFAHSHLKCLLLQKECSPSRGIVFLYRCSELQVLWKVLDSSGSLKYRREWFISALSLYTLTPSISFYIVLGFALMFAVIAILVRWTCLSFSINFPHFIECIACCIFFLVLLFITLFLFSFPASLTLWHKILFWDKSFLANLTLFTRMQLKMEANPITEVSACRKSLK